MNSKLTVLISSCDAFSDLWDAHLAFYHQNWEMKECRTVLVTDKPTDRAFDDVDIIVAEEGMDFPLRIKYALDSIKTPYVLLTLDDYFLISKSKRDDISTLLHYAETDKIDYLQLYDRRKINPKKYEKIGVLHDINLSDKYAVNLYPAIWSVEFLRKTVKDNVSPWLYEPSLTKTAKEEDAICRFSHTGTFEMLDVIRKGKVLHKAKKYLKKRNVVIGDRPTVPYRTELKLAIMDFISWHAPKCLFKPLKKTAKKLGMKFYSED